MNSINIHEIILDKGTLQILSADAAFYAFMGERLYVPFEKFIPEEDQKTFYQKLSDCSGERFMVRLIGENGKKSFYFSRIKAGPSQSSVSVFLLYAEALVEIRSQLKKSVSIKNALLELYHDTYFEYEPSNDTIRLYTLERCEQNIGSYPLEKFECRLMLHADEEQKKTIHEFITSLRIGARRFEMCANRNLKQAGAGFGTDTNIVTLISPDNTVQLPLMSKEEVSDKLLTHIMEEWKGADGVR